MKAKKYTPSSTVERPKRLTASERMELKRRKRKLGPAALRRAERRKHLQPVPMEKVDG